MYYVLVRKYMVNTIIGMIVDRANSIDVFTH